MKRTYRCDDCSDDSPCILECDSDNGRQEPPMICPYYGGDAVWYPRDIVEKALAEVDLPAAPTMGDEVTLLPCDKPLKVQQANEYTNIMRETFRHDIERIILSVLREHGLIKE